MKLSQIFLPLLILAGWGCAQTDPKIPSNLGKDAANKSGKKETLVVGAGCFWCIEAKLEMLKGVDSVVSGYAGGTKESANYGAVSSGDTDHVEVVEVSFDSKVITRADLLRVFFVSHDPTTKNRQGPDVGPMYRSAVFYSNPEEKALAEKIIAEVEKEKLFKAPVVTTLEPLTQFYKAEEYHQDYFKKYETADEATRAKMNGGYCAYIVGPEVAKFKKKFAHLLKK